MSETRPTQTPAPQKRNVGCSQMWPFLSYGQCPVPSCPDKGSLRVLQEIDNRLTATRTRHPHVVMNRRNRTQHLLDNIMRLVENRKVGRSHYHGRRKVKTAHARPRQSGYARLAQFNGV